MSVKGASPPRLYRRFVLLALSAAATLASVLGASACSPLVALNEWLVPEDGYVRHRGPSP